MKPATRSRAFLTELAQAVGWSLVSVSASLGIIVLLATAFLRQSVGE